MRLPEKIRHPLGKVVKNLTTRGSITSISLFGSWSRGDADASSDVDLLVADDRPFEYEYTERFEQNGALIDFNFIPQRWISGTMPPEIDQKIHEAYILYDREWTMAGTKEHMMNAFYSPERLNLRLENYLVDADIYLSRATSAHARGDPESARLFAVLSAQTILKTIVDAAKLPVNISSFLEKLETATKQFDKSSLFCSYLALARLENLDPMRVEERVGDFKQVWDEISSSERMNRRLLDSIHFKVKTKITYHTTPAFLQGMILRSRALLDENRHQEAAHYMMTTLADMLENYAWLRTTEQNIRFDYTTLLRTLRGLKQKPSTLHENIVEALDLTDTDEKEAEKAINSARQIILQVRQQRKTILNQMQEEAY